MAKFMSAKEIFSNENIDQQISRSNIFDKIRSWAMVRGIYDKGNSHTQYVKLMEEAGELARALLKNDKPEVIDSIGDIVVVLTNLAKLEKLNIEDCIDNAYATISKRTGKMVNGTFVKTESL
jgi:NTP pyrophosphatase (non-canonical NTP hydrolase)